MPFFQGSKETAALLWEAAISSLNRMKSRRRAGDPATESTLRHAGGQVIDPRQRRRFLAIRQLGSTVPLKATRNAARNGEEPSAPIE